ncbi:MAG: 50S ribosomal protein L18 [Candidatus Pacebacteria bacterium]|nr:50S ribosomal protein L18 [Candidatus Paceibacterota bacterium]
MNNQQLKQKRKKRLHAKVRAKIKNRITGVLRLNVFRSNKSLFLQIIDDNQGKTLVSAYSKEIKEAKNKTEESFELGKLLAQKAKDKKISKVVFDRGSYRYHGRVKAAAEGAREGGLLF